MNRMVYWGTMILAGLTLGALLLVGGLAPFFLGAALAVFSFFGGIASLKQD